jgi:hypothetical protein
MGFEDALKQAKNSEGISRASWGDRVLYYNQITDEIEDYNNDSNGCTCNKWKPTHDDIVAVDWMIA